MGFLIKEMFERFENKSKSILDPNRSMWIYSAHDTTVARLLNVLGLYEVYIFLCNSNTFICKYLIKI